MQPAAAVGPYQLCVVEGPSFPLDFRLRNIRKTSPSFHVLFKPQFYAISGLHVVSCSKLLMTCVPAVGQMMVICLLSISKPNTAFLSFDSVPPGFPGQCFLRQGPEARSLSNHSIIGFIHGGSYHTNYIQSFRKFMGNRFPFLLVGLDQFGELREGDDNL
jgi:hypothetical protein